MATCDVSFDEMAVALSYISLGSGAASSAPASSARGLVDVQKKEPKAKKAAKPEADDDVSQLTLYARRIEKEELVQEDGSLGCFNVCATGFV